MNMERKKPDIIKTIRVRYHNLVKHFKTLEKNVTAETIKPFRIEIKKIRAFLRLLALESKNQDLPEFPKSLKRMHKSGGHLRDAEMHQKRISDYIAKNPGISYDRKILLRSSISVAKKEKKRFF